MNKLITIVTMKSCFVDILGEPNIVTRLINARQRAREFQVVVQVWTVVTDVVISIEEESLKSSLDQTTHARSVTFNSNFCYI